ncbi:MAG: glycosyltransferase family 2 protein [Gammaproteobacteria bacterium]|nr:glycosyltransferase family 2 protein [Gammaproteobacteria bacterium]
MKLSIIIVNYRSWGHLQTALDALQADFPADWEIIVVDNESQAEPFHEFQASFPWVTFVAHAHNSGFGFGCNLGASRASGAALLFMNPDVIASCDDIGSLMQEKAAHPDVALISPKQLAPSGRPQKVFDDFPGLLNQSKILKALLRILWPSRFMDPRADYDALTYCDWITGSCLLVSRENFDAIGGWSEDYWMYVEDADLCRRAHDLGLRVAYAPDVQVVHAHGGSSRLNVDIKAMTKLEVIISKHVYANNHFRGARRLTMHLLIGGLRLPVLTVTAIADLITLRQIPALRVRSKMLSGLLSYYAGVQRTGTWLSPRAIANRRCPTAGARPTGR